MTAPNGRPNLDAGACPSIACERLCGADDCECPPCLCPRCSARRLVARKRAERRGALDAIAANVQHAGGTLADADVGILSLFD